MDAFHTIPTTPYEDQKPGTSGLRKRVTDFKQPHYLENFVQSIFDTVRDFRGGKILLGGDGRYFNDEAVQIILRMSSANGVSEVILGKNAILSTPAASHLIRKYHLNGGLVLSASHNPAGQNGDFGVKLNLETGGPAPTSVTDAIFARSQTLSHYRIADGNIDTSRIGTQNLGDMRVTVVDPVEDFAEFMEELFDFSAIKALIESGFSIAFDAMSAVTGPYATEIFGNRLGVSHDQLYNTRPLPDFGGAHPDPNPVHANALFDRMFGPNPPDFGAASDGDGDRYIALGPHFYVSPSDCLAVIAANAHLAPGYKDGIKGIARSMPTGRAADNVAAHLNIPIYETPTGWKYFGNLMDAGRITICGEESASTSSDHIREKDGLWGVLMWLNIIAAKGESVEAIVRAHWRQFGRHYYTRHDYEEVDKASAESIIATLHGQLETLTGRSLQGETIEVADSFTYTDPVDGTVTKNQGLRVFFESGSRLVMRLSGTGTKGATLRIYLERYVGPEGDHDIDLAEATAGLAMIADTLTDLKQTLNRDAPSVIS
ncbi:alpha-D-glucose phosphate-specific phosphoglucomutase [Litorimonas cladophorae]|uniref:phosphoglucomutase (alpha-D-glucose-1,6-bisphosphate-dependent) n=1 Tax=Litorimonas cladophorae TaxID=1220491 RepID=A0A918KEL8_9PROT|nr:alpha-D-glucose phosphate-specific phosphoglucomutase [Litorimonas cladophorae]GGX59037.1 alpha-D-glucose phosphate-specific phosphoglucomutase [Litorimonas cladophorae]